MNTVPADSTCQTISRGDKWLLGLLFVLAGLTYRELFTWQFSLHEHPNYVGWFFDLSDTSPQFHYLLAIGLFYVRRKDIGEAFQGNGTPWSAMLFLLPGAALLLWGRYVTATDIVYLSFILVGFGTARFLSGKRLSRMILFPALILFLAIPLPAVLINQIVFPFQLWTAEHIAWLLNVAGIPSWPAGDMIIMAGHSNRVAESCTALGFMKWLLVFALAYAYLFPVSRLHAAVLILSAPVIAYAVNLLRAFSLVLNPGLEVLEIHLAQGIIFFLIGFSLLYMLDTLLLRLLGTRKEASSTQSPNGRCEMNPDRKHKPLLILLTLFSVLFVVSLATPRWSESSESPAMKIVFAEEMGDWKLLHTPSLNRLFLGSIRYSSYLYRIYARNKETVFLFIGHDDRWQRNQSLLSNKNAYQDQIGLIEERSLVNLKTINKTAVSVATNNLHGHILSYHWYEGVDSVSQEILRALLALDQSPLRRPAGALVIRLSTHVAPPTPQGRARADKRLHDFLHDMRKMHRQKKEPD